MTTASRPLATALCAGALRGRLAPATPPPGGTTAKALSDEGLQYFKMREAMALDGEFKSGWTAPLRNQLILKLIAIIEEFDPSRIECFLKRSDFDDYVRGIIGGLLSATK
jgi:hypothetical protein